MTNITQTTPPDPLFRAAGRIAIVSGVISAVGVVLLIAMYLPLPMTPPRVFGLTFGGINDICVAIQYLATIPLALALYRLLLPHNPMLIRIATVAGMAAMVAVVALQLLLIFKVLTFEQQVGWVSLAMIAGVGSWLIITGYVGRSTRKLPRSLLMSILAVPYLGYPVWALWLGRLLLSDRMAEQHKGLSR
jgi:hypothetical protein